MPSVVRSYSLRLASACAILASAVATHAATRYYAFPLTGAQEVPANASTAKGLGVVILDDVTGAVTVTGNFTGLAANATAAHIHVAPAGVNGPVIVGLTPTAAMQGTVTGAGVFTAAQIASMIGGGMYVNIHNATFPGGEIRGQVAQSPLVPVFDFLMSGLEEVPPNASPASGHCTIALLPSSGGIVLMGQYTGMLANVTASHIHNAPAGVNGPVIVNVTNLGGVAGTLSANAFLTAAQTTQMLASRTYVNVHTTVFPGGEIRGQARNRCPADLDLDGVVGAADLASMLGAWGGSGLADLDGNGTVGASDLAAMLGGWGACPAQP